MRMLEGLLHDYEFQISRIIVNQES